MNMNRRSFLGRIGAVVGILAGATLVKPAPVAASVEMIAEPESIGGFTVPEPLASEMQRRWLPSAEDEMRRAFIYGLEKSANALRLQATYGDDGSVEAISLMPGHEFEGVVVWSRDLLNGSDPRFLSWDGETITASLTNGTATYLILGDAGMSPDSLVTLLIGVEPAV